LIVVNEFPGTRHRLESILWERTMDQATQPLRAGTKQLTEDFRTVVKDAEQLLRELANQAGDGYADARVRLEASVSDARQRLADLEQALGDGARRAGRATDGYVREHPWESIAVGAGIGVLLGALLARR
jgi:ElaB/YqjD/DUF883 family membrane-anchored ribosome-binding protein